MYKAIQQLKDELLLIVAGVENVADPPNSLSSLHIQEDTVPNDQISALDAYFDFDVSLYFGAFTQVRISTAFYDSAAVMYCNQRGPWGGKQECDGQHIEDELKRYMLEPQTNWRVNNVMQWWSDHEANFPHIALLALKYLAIPASSAPSERVFSQLKLVIDRKRWRMDAGRVERVIFLRCIIYNCCGYYFVPLIATGYRPGPS